MQNYEQSIRDSQMGANYDTKNHSSGPHHEMVSKMYWWKVLSKCLLLQILALSYEKGWFYYISISP